MRSLPPSINKKGQLAALGPTIILFVVAAVFLVLGLIMLTTLRDTDLVADGLSATVTNETLTPTTAGAAVTESTRPGFNDFAITIVYNWTTGYVVEAGNYTITAAGLVQNTTGDPNVCPNNAVCNWNVTYSFNSGGAAYDGSNSTITGLANFSQFWELMVLAVLISIVVGLLFLAFGRRGEKVR